MPPSLMVILLQERIILIHYYGIEGAPDHVKKMRAQYDEFIKRVNNLKRSRDGEALYLADRGLAEIQLTLTKSNEIDTALKLRQYREEFKRPPEPKKPKPLVVVDDDDNDSECYR